MTAKNPTKWTEKNVLTIRAPGKSLDERVNHPSIKGLAIRFRAQIKDGVRVDGGPVYTHYFPLNGVTKKISIAEVGAVTLEHAEDESLRLAASMTGVAPVSPVVARKAALEGLSVTLGAVVVKYLAALATQGVTKEYIASRTLYLNERAASLHAHPIKQVGRSSLITLLANAETEYGKTSSDNLRRALSAFFYWAIMKNHCEIDPTTHLPKMEKVKRTNVPQVSELAVLWRSAGVLAARRFPGSDVARRYGIIVKLLLLTAARRNQIGQLRWDEVHLDPAAEDRLPPHIMLQGKLSADEQRRIVKAGGTVGQSRSKNRTQFMIVLSRQAVKLLRDLQAEQLAQGPLPTCVFAGWNKENGFTTWGQGAELLKEVAGPGHWIHHDFRRSFQTLGQDDVKIPFHVVDISINHVPQAQSGTAGSYNFATLKDERTEAAQKWADYLVNVATPKQVLKIAA